MITKNIFLLTLFFLIKGYDVSAQQTHQYTLTSNQPPALEVNAGEDIYTAPGVAETLGDNPAATGGTTPYRYSWQPSENLSDPEVANPEVVSGQSDKTYTLTVTDDAGCTATDEITLVVGITPLTENKKSHIAIYPNPVFEQLTIQTGNHQGTLTLFDSQGKMVLKEAVSPVEHQMDIHALPEGMYMLKLHVDQEDHVFQVYIQK